MLLPQTAEYALRALAQMATLPQGRRVRARDLSKMTKIPPQYLSKVLRRLSAGKLLSSEKGHGGGFSIARPLQEIRFIDVLAALDLAPEPNRCVFGRGHCSAHKPCLLHPSFTKLSQAFEQWSIQSTLADLPRPTRRASRARANGPR